MILYYKCNNTNKIKTDEYVGMNIADTYADCQIDVNHILTVNNHN